MDEEISLGQAVAGCVSLPLFALFGLLAWAWLIGSIIVIVLVCTGPLLLLLSLIGQYP